MDSPEAFLVTTVTRLAIDELRSAAAPRGLHRPWLPEPILTAEADVDPARLVEIASRSRSGCS